VLGDVTGFLSVRNHHVVARSPDRYPSRKVEVLIVDQISLAVGTVADRLKIPFVSICNALLLNREPGVPPYFTNWEYQDNFVSKFRNRFNALADYLTESLWQIVVKQRQQWQLPAHSSREMAGSQLAQICQIPAAFDFPRKNLPACLHYVGPLQDPESKEPVNANQMNFPWEQLTDKPLVYASLGTLQNRNWQIFELIATACVDLDAQLVISLGNPNQDLNAVKLAGKPILVAYAPHQALIDRSALVITVV
jgi:zeaxanthin glucosyltransferase